MPHLTWGPYTPRYYKLVKVETKNGYSTYMITQEDAHDTVPDDMKVVKSTVPLPVTGPGYSSLGFDPNSSTLWRGQHDMHFENDMIPFLVRRVFKKLLIEAVRDLRLRDHIYVSRKVSGPAITFSIEDKRLDQVVSVDFAPTARLQMPFQSSVTWPRPNVMWPTRQKAQTVKAKGVNFVAKKDMDWLVSYAEAEKELREGMDEDGGCRSKVHRIMKKVKEDFLCKDTKPVLSSYVLKNLLFWECEKYPSSSAWAHDQLDVRLNTMLDRLEQSLREGSLLHYFDPRVNLLQDKDKEKMHQALRNLAKFRANSAMYLRQVED